MKKKLLVLAWPVGFVLFLIYYSINRFLYPIPEIVAYPVLSIAAIFLLIGCFYNGYCMSTGKDPYKFYE